MLFVRITILIVTTFFCSNVGAQTKEKIFISANGDTLRKGNFILIKGGQHVTHIYPSVSTQPAYRDIYLNYLQREMAGKSYKIDRLIKIKEGKKNFRTIAVIVVGDKELNKFQNVEYNVNWEKAIEKGEVELIR